MVQRIGYVSVYFHQDCVDGFKDPAAFRTLNSERHLGFLVMAVIDFPNQARQLNA